MDTNKITTIKLKGSTKSLLDKLKLIERESYDEVIQRLIQSFSKEHPEESSEEQPEVGSEKQLESSFKTKEIVPEPIQSAKEEKVKLLKSILGSITNNKKEGEERERKEKVKISSRFKYP